MENIFMRIYFHQKNSSEWLFSHWHVFVKYYDVFALCLTWNCIAHNMIKESYDVSFEQQDPKYLSTRSTWHFGLCKSNHDYFILLYLKFEWIIICEKSSLFKLNFLTCQEKMFYISELLTLYVLAWWWCLYYCRIFWEVF